MPDPLKVFVSYSHRDAEYLDDSSLLGFLKGLEKDNVEFWDDRRIRPGELWDDVIKANLKKADIALVLVSQAFLDSRYCQNVEIEQCLAQQKHLFPIILSPCDWRRHDWLSRRQFLPGGDQTVEEHYTESGRRKRLFLEIREQLRERVEWVREPLGSTPITTQFQDIQKQLRERGDLAHQALGLPPTPTRLFQDIQKLREKGELSRQPLGSPSIFTKSNPAIKDENGVGKVDELIPLKSLPGPVQITLCQRLGEDWANLASPFKVFT